MSSDPDDPGIADTVEQGPESRALRERPRGDELVREVAKNKIANALFAKAEHTVIGRYRLLERVGVGGMGVVWGAWDPQLERRVALKLVKVKTDGARDRMLAEGQTLAKLSHPNVVPIYDVGTVDDQVYLVMEWIRGENLRAYCKDPRPTAEIVRLYRAAGEGLVAAHREGIIHRDFKPDNVMVGEDGRVRVLDFGLARTESGTGEDVAGTPRYMAPEQARGEMLAAAVDQFAFCVSLRESLTQHGEVVPGWIAAIVARGTQPVAADRFPSMDRLLHALGRHPARVWRRRLVTLAALASVGVAFAVGTMRSQGPGACEGAAAELADVWNPVVRANVLAHGHSLGPYGFVESQYLAASLDDYRRRWIAAHRGACLAHRRGEITERLYENALGCIVRARAAFSAVSGLLVRATPASYPDAVFAARDLPEVDRCVAEATDSSVVEPPPQLAGRVRSLDADATHAVYLSRGGERERALQLAQATATAADLIGYPPLVARAQLALGLALSSDDNRPELLMRAIPAYAKSTYAALSASDDVQFVEAFARELFAAGRLSNEIVPPEAKFLEGAFPFVEVVAIRTGAAGGFARALFYNNAGTTRLAAGDHAGARAWFRKARDEMRAGASNVELTVALGNLAMVAEDRRERDALFEEERASLEHALGPMHAFTLRSRLRAAIYIEHRDRAASVLADICDKTATWYPELIDRIAKCRYEVGWLADERGDRAAARAAYTSVIASRLDEAELARAQLALLDGDAEDANRRASEIALRAQEAESWFVRFPGGVDALQIAANARLAVGKTEEAIAALRSALDFLADARINRSTRYRRRLGRIQWQLATLLAKRDPAQAHALAAKAVSWSKDAGGYDERIGELLQIRAE